MKTTFFSILIGGIFIISCTKNNTVSNDLDFQLKRIDYAIDTVTPLCFGCPPVITQKSEHFFYYTPTKLISRILTVTTLSSTPARIDTTAIYSYTYSGLRIIAYSEDKRGVIINHILNYDTQNRLLKDTIINPSLTNNKTTYFEYLPDTIIQTNIFSNAVLSAFSKDTIILIGNTISKEFIRTHNSNGTSSDQEFTYTASSFRNPLNYVNNNVLFASDYKNESGFYTFSIYNPQNIMPVLATQVVTKSWNNSLPPTQFTAYLASTLDSLGRVHSIIELNNRNRTSIYLYY